MHSHAEIGCVEPKAGDIEGHGKHNTFCSLDHILLMARVSEQTMREKNKMSNIL